MLNWNSDFLFQIRFLHKKTNYFDLKLFLSVGSRWRRNPKKWFIQKFEKNSGNKNYESFKKITNAAKLETLSPPESEVEAEKLTFKFEPNGAKYEAHQSKFQ